MKSILTPEEQIDFHRQKGLRQIGAGLVVLALAAGYYFYAGPSFRDSPPERVNAIFYAFYSALGITGGGIAISAIGGIFFVQAFREFRAAKKIKDSGL